MIKKTLILLVMFAGIAGWESLGYAVALSSPVIAIVAGELFTGEAKGHLDGSGTISIQSRTKPDDTCHGEFTSSEKLGGKGNIRCGENVTTKIKFKRLGSMRGYGSGTSSRGPMSFTYGLSAIESKPYLKLPRGKILVLDGESLELKDEK